MWKRLLLTVGMLGALAAAQGIFFQGIAQTVGNQTGQGTVVVPIPGATTYVCLGVWDGTTACTAANQTPVYSNNSLTNPVTQPLVADSQGNWGFWASANNYFYTTCGSPSQCATYQITLGGAGLSGDDIHFNQSLSGGAANTFFANPFYQLMQRASTPAAPTLQVTGGTGHTWGYEVVELVGPNAATVASTEAFANAAATLNISNFVTITAACQSNNDEIQFYRVASGGTPASTGVIGTTACASNSTAVLVDTGLNGDGSNPASLTNTTGDLGASTFYAGSSVTTLNGRQVFTGRGNFIFPSSNGGSIFSDVLGSSDLTRLGINFAGNVMVFGSMNHDGSFSDNRMMTIASPSGPIFNVGLGLGGTSTTSNSSVWSYLFPQNNGTSVYAALFSKNAIGSGLPQTNQGPIMASFVEPAAQFNGTIAPPGTNSSFFTCATGLVGCGTAGMYQVTLYAAENGACTSGGTVSFAVAYTDAVGGKTAGIPLSGTGVSSNVLSLGSGTTTNFASGSVVFWSVNSSVSLQFTGTGCNAAGVNIKAEFRRLN